MYTELPITTKYRHGTNNKRKNPSDFIKMKTFYASKDTLRNVERADGLGDSISKPHV